MSLNHQLLEKLGGDKAVLAFQGVIPNDRLREHSQMDYNNVWGNYSNGWSICGCKEIPERNKAGLGQDRETNSKIHRHIIDVNTSKWDHSMVLRV